MGQVSCQVSHQCMLQDLLVYLFLASGRETFSVPYINVDVYIFLCTVFSKKKNYGPGVIKI